MNDFPDRYWVHDIDPFVIRFPDGFFLPGIRWYGLSYLAGFVVGWWLLRTLARRGRLGGVRPEEAGDLIFWAAVGAVLGGRIGYSLLYNLETTLHAPWALFQVWHGGMASHGGMLGVTLALMAWWARRERHGDFAQSQPEERADEGKGTERTERTDGSDRSDKSEGSDKSDRSDRSDRSDGSDRSDRSDKSEGPSSPSLSPPSSSSPSLSPDPAPFLSGGGVSSVSDSPASRSSRRARRRHAPNSSSKDGASHRGGLASSDNALRNGFPAAARGGGRASARPPRPFWRRWVGALGDPGFWRMGDGVTAASTLGLCFGRVANFINGELWGRQTDVPWAVIFPTSPPPFVPRHPSALYQAALEGLVLFAWLFPGVWRGRWKPGGGVARFVVGYAVVRFIGEFFREPDEGIGYQWLNLTRGQWLSVVMVGLGFALMACLSRTIAKETGEKTATR